MKSLVKRIIGENPTFLDFLLIPFVVLSALVLKLYRSIGSRRLRHNTQALKRLGVFPIVDHYYEPLFTYDNLRQPLRAKRNLPALDFKLDEQLKLLNSLVYQKEFECFVNSELRHENDEHFRIENDSFGSGDAEFLYNFIRHLKPKRVIEIGCGTSTKIIRQALLDNGGAAEHICIEPYEQAWLEKFDRITLIRDKLETCLIDWSQDLQAGDFLFIDSSHMIRPQGDVLYEYLEVIPQLRSGVVVHVHDIFTPYDYLDDWLKVDTRFWNEQYILEATLGNSDRYKILASLNYLRHEHYGELKKVCTYLQEDREPGSFYFQIV